MYATFAMGLWGREEKPPPPEDGAFLVNVFFINNFDGSRIPAGHPEAPGDCTIRAIDSSGQTVATGTTVMGYTKLMVPGTGLPESFSIELHRPPDGPHTIYVNVPLSPGETKVIDINLGRLNVSGCGGYRND